MADNYSQLIQQLDQKREKYKAQLRLSLQEEEDPLALYEQFVKWTVDSYPDVLVSRSGLLELLEEATRQFIDDLAYKGDLRYLKLWSLYASHVEDPNVIYAFLISNNIGTMYAQVYEEYAAALERNGRCVSLLSLVHQVIDAVRLGGPMQRMYIFKGSNVALAQWNV